MVLLVGSARKSEVWCYSLAQQGSLKYGATRWLSKEVLSMVLLVGSARKSEVWCSSLAQQGSLKYGATRWLSKEV